ncbi:MAG: zinc ribbon domain-containing protein, partial [Thermoplasmata archaeon]|nr:zinc ribbon domain-containing protein [Thermoplasmata archaeon]
AFTDPSLTLEQQIERLVGMSVSQMNMPEEKARAWANDVLPNLRRWKN